MNFANNNTNRSKAAANISHRFKETNKDTFTPVDGILCPFESPLKSTIRETFEETGIKVTTMKHCGVLTETSPIEYN